MTFLDVSPLPGAAGSRNAAQSAMDCVQEQYVCLPAAVSRVAAVSYMESVHVTLSGVASLPEAVCRVTAVSSTKSVELMFFEVASL